MDEKEKLVREEAAELNRRRPLTEAEEARFQFLLDFLARLVGIPHSLRRRDGTRYQLGVLRMSDPDDVTRKEICISWLAERAVSTWARRIVDHPDMSAERSAPSTVDMVGDGVHHRCFPQVA